jgi:hypothetical protein
MLSFYPFTTNRNLLSGHASCVVAQRVHMCKDAEGDN